MGFSHGGALTMLASTAWAKATYAPHGAPSFRAFIPFYPNCNGAFPERGRVSAPVRIHIGEADDWTPAKPCAELAAALKASGQDVTIHIYPGARHGFDQAPPREIHLPKVNNGSLCFPRPPSILGPVASASVAGCLKKRRHHRRQSLRRRSGAQEPAHAVGRIDEVIFSRTVSVPDLASEQLRVRFR